MRVNKKGSDKITLRYLKKKKLSLTFSIKKSTTRLKIQRFLYLTLPNTARSHHLFLSLCQPCRSWPPCTGVSGQRPGSLTDCGASTALRTGMFTHRRLADSWLTLKLQQCLACPRVSRWRKATAFTAQINQSYSSLANLS